MTLSSSPRQCLSPLRSMFVVTLCLLLLTSSFRLSYGQSGTTGTPTTTTTTPSAPTTTTATPTTPTATPTTPTTTTATPTAPTGGGGDTGGGGGTATTNNGGGGSSGLGAGAIVGIVIGGVVGLCVFLAILFAVCCVELTKPRDAPVTTAGPAETYSAVPTTVTTTSTAPAPLQTQNVTSDSYNGAAYNGAAYTGAPFANPSVITYHTAGGTEVPTEGLGHVGNDDHVVVMPSAPVADVGGF